jgi:hypothetical protein
MFPSTQLQHCSLHIYNDVFEDNGHIQSVFVQSFCERYQYVETCHSLQLGKTTEKDTEPLGRRPLGRPRRRWEDGGQNGP